MSLIMGHHLAGKELALEAKRRERMEANDKQAKGPQERV